MIKECVICGKGFEARSNKITCGNECSRVNDLQKKRDHTNRNRSCPIERERYLNQKRINKEVVCVICGSCFIKVGQSKTCSKKCSKALKKSWRASWRASKKGKLMKAKGSKAYRVRYPEKKVSEYLRSQLGTEPPADLVEEATALRLLNRVLRS